MSFDPKTLKKDPDFEGSMWKQMGLTEYLCPKCDAHLSMTETQELICLNACHMTEAQQKKFAMLLAQFVNRHG